MVHNHSTPVCFRDLSDNMSVCSCLGGDGHHLAFCTKSSAERGEDTISSATSHIDLAHRFQRKMQQCA